MKVFAQSTAQCGIKSLQGVFCAKQCPVLAIPLFSFSPVCRFFSVWIGNVLCIVCFPDELARVASVLCAEVCVKCFVCRELYNNCNLFYSFDSEQTAEVCRKSVLC